MPRLKRTELFSVLNTAPLSVVVDGEFNLWKAYSWLPNTA